MRISVCDDQAEVLLAVERMFSGGGLIAGIENVDTYQDIRKLKKRIPGWKSTGCTDHGYLS